MLLPEQPHLLPLPLFSISRIRELLWQGHSNLQAPPAQQVSRNGLRFHGPQVHLSLCPAYYTNHFVHGWCHSPVCTRDLSSTLWQTEQVLWAITGLDSHLPSTIGWSLPSFGLFLDCSAVPNLKAEIY